MSIPVTVVDLGLGNLGSVLQALRRAGGNPSLSSGPGAVAKAQRLVLPGVAAFGLGMERADQLSLKPALLDALARGTPILGICLGMQILFEEGDEDGTREGLGLLPGRVTKLPPTVSVPHIGWQKLVVTQPGPLSNSGWMYFANSYRCEAPADVTCSVAKHGTVNIAAVVQRGQVHGVQFHPEKSARDGQELLSKFLALPQGLAA